MQFKLSVSLLFGVCKHSQKSITLIWSSSICHVILYFLQTNEWSLFGVMQHSSILYDGDSIILTFICKLSSDFSSTIKLLNQNSFIYCMIQCKSGHGPSKKPSNTHHHPNFPGLRHTLNLRAGARPGTNRFSYYNSDNSHWERERER